MSSLGPPSTLYVQRDSCPAEALSRAADLPPTAELPIVFGSIDTADAIEPAEEDDKGMGEHQIEPLSIATPPPELQSSTAPAKPPIHCVDLFNENDIETVHAQQEEMVEDPLQLFEESAPNPATAAPPAPDESAEQAAYMEYLKKHVPYWTREPVWEDWFDKEHPQESIDKDTKRLYDLGEQFIADISKCDGPVQAWLTLSMARHGLWWRNKDFVSGR